MQPCADAANFFQTFSTLEEEADNFSCVARKTVRQHAKFLEQKPSAVKLLPDLAAKNSMSKRLWEKVMYDGRAIIDFPGSEERSSIALQIPSRPLGRPFLISSQGSVGRLSSPRGACEMARPGVSWLWRAFWSVSSSSRQQQASVGNPGSDRAATSK